MTKRGISKTTCSLLAWLAAALLPCACQVATPSERIGEHPALYASLPEAEQALVQQGKIREGMSTGAVFLAWGYPNTRPFIGEREGRRVERWVYARMEPVMVTPTWGARGWCHHDLGLPETACVPRDTASVTFEEGRVVSWEARQ